MKEQKEEKKIFKGITFCFLYTWHTKRLKDLLKMRGASLQADYKLSEASQYAVCGAGAGEEVFEELSKRKDIDVRALKGHVKFVKSQWLTACIKENKLVDPDWFVVEVPQQEGEEAASSSLPRSLSNSQYSAWSQAALDNTLDLSLPYEEDEEELAVQDTLRRLRFNWLHFKDFEKLEAVSVLQENGAAKDGDGEIPTNQYVVSELKRLLEVYQIDQRRDCHGNKVSGFGAKATRTAIAILSTPPYGEQRQIKDASEILSKAHGGRMERGVGPKTAQKIADILASPDYRLPRVVLAEGDPDYVVIKTFRAVWGCGEKMSLRWYENGLRTIDDVLKFYSENGEPGQMIGLGLKYYESLQKPVSRESMESAHRAFKAATEPLAEDLEVILAGSYRRGKPSTHDVDFLVISGNEDLGRVMKKIVKALQDSGFLLDFLQTGSENKFKHGKDGAVLASCMVMGIIRLPGSGQVCRADFKLYHKISRAFALLHNTGSAEFNRAMRFWPIGNREGIQKALDERMKAPTEPVVRSWLSKKRSRDDQQKEIYRESTQERPNSVKLTDTALVPVRREESEGGQLKRDVLWEAASWADCIHCETEEDVFKALGLAYVPPHRRNMDVNY
ncbi:DNA polymerase lambda [Chloropicon primus]|uniref:DNA polymerase n=1 Tax=Chloropicon primus TaxID=1764295 RepID=A0A5B8MPB1_9CHLO|nr:DNA polymerase lambda [Chloropicon primus]|mmetsp:Transcript_11504/g.31923  ORF Transcript_11504/g.31923 Transcript_11504/m.31923 type:complete len:617 (-) Transcript_11504:677-2527(-)|eukprot:QDZ21874.1 DNA polymerase lambda [Chloropicon primus]